MDIKNNYTSRDFASVRSELEQVIKRYYPDSFKDFSASSFNSAILGLLAYMGDKASFYIDYYNNESNLFTANNRDSIYKHAYGRGYKINSGNTATGSCSFYIKVPANNLSLSPDVDYIPVLRSGSTFSANSQVFLLTEDVMFSSGEVRVGDVDANTGSPLNYIIKQKGVVISGEFAEEEFAVGTFESFLKLRLKEPDVAEIISITDSGGNEYFEVENLTQNLLFLPSTPDGTGEMSLKMVAAPRRFVFGRDAAGSFVLFGSGSERVDWESATETPQVVFDMVGKQYLSDHVFSPSVLVSHDKFGVAPENTTLTILYRKSSLSDVKVGVGSLNSPVEANLHFKNDAALDRDKIASVVSSLELENEEPIVGYYIYESNSELKQRVVDFVSAQGRIVNLSDYKSFMYAMPRKFGSIKRCNAVVTDVGGRPEIHCFVLSEDEDGNLAQTNTQVKNNLVSWLSINKLSSDVVKIFDAYVVNIGIDFEFVASSGKMKHRVKTEAVQALRQFYLNKMDIGEPLSVSSIFKVLHGVPGVLDVTRIHVFQKAGGDYSDVPYSLLSHRSQDGLSYSALQNVVFEVKYPTIDISGDVR